METNALDDGRTAIPILLYHAVTDNPGSHIAPFTVTPENFARQLDVVLDSGFRCITFSRLVDELRSPASHSGPAVEAGPDLRRTAVITFDDGFADFYENAAPALEERSLKSTMYVTTGWLEGRASREPGPTDRMLDWSQLPELEARGVEIGAHSHSHPQLDTLRSAALRDEMVRPKELLENALGHQVRSVAYPHGYNGPRVQRAARRAGYDSAAAVRNRQCPQGEDVFRISRLTVLSTTTPDELSAWLEPPVAGSAPLRESLRTTAGRAYRRSLALLRGRPGTAYA